jgi:lysyl-tRNA synthetase class 2
MDGHEMASSSAIVTDTEKSRQIRTVIAARARLLRAIRSFFDLLGYLETSTPIVIPAPAPEEFIECPLGGRGYLRASPELEMKRLLAEGVAAIYQIGPCFREGETGRLHNEEFTMLEWYRAGEDYRDLLAVIRRLLVAAAEPFHPSGICRFRGADIDFGADWEILTVHEAFARYADTDPESLIESDHFEETLVEKIEPNLGIGRPTVLIDYPSRFAALARRKPDRSDLAERWELYLGGVEIANAYSELTDPHEQRERFLASANARARNGFRNYPEPLPFFAALDAGIPECAGCALGLDRLLMVMLNADRISDVIL